MKHLICLLILSFFVISSFAKEQNEELDALLYENISNVTTNHGVTETDLLENYDEYKEMSSQYQRYQNMMELIQLQTMVDSVADLTKQLKDPAVQERHSRVIEKQVDNELWYVMLLCFLSVSSLIVALQFLKQKSYKPRDVINITGLTLIIFGTIILVLVVDTSEQLTAAIGILGAVAGYLFRSAQEDLGNNNSSK